MLNLCGITINIIKNCYLYILNNLNKKYEQTIIKP